jgi:hypothetical protein
LKRRGGHRFFRPVVLDFFGQASWPNKFNTWPNMFGNLSKTCWPNLAKHAC